MSFGKSDIHAAGPECLTWNPEDIPKSLDDLRAFVEEEAQKAVNWYWKAKKAKKTFSWLIQLFTLVLTASAALVPIVVQIIKNAKPGEFDGFDSGPIASLLVGLAAGLIGLDKAFGYSTGWVRYVLTSTSMTKVLQEFRLDWVAIYAAAANPPTVEQQAALIQRAKVFIVDIQGMLLQETKDWVNEFQSNMAQVEKDAKAQLDTLKAQVEKIAKDREDGARRGAIELTVPNADKTEGFHFEVTLEGTAGSVVSAATNSKVWTQINTTPGQYRLKIGAKAKGVAVSTETVFDVKPGEKKEVSLTLPIAP